MKKILIITEVFPPAFNPRMGYLVKYLPEFGWYADIITNNTNKDNNYESLVGKNKIIRVNLKHTEKPHNYFQKLWHLLNLKRHFLLHSHQFIKDINRNFIQDNYIAILISVSYNDLFVLKAGMKISKSWNIPFIVDLRDIHEQKPEIIKENYSLKTSFINHLLKSFIRRKLKLRNKVLKYARAVISVSTFHIEQLSQYNNNLTLIYNGYDPDLFQTKCLERVNIFTIVYTGLIFDENEQDPTLLFEAISHLEKHNIINEACFKIVFYTPENCRSSILKNKLYNVVSKYIEFHNYIKYEQVPSILKSASIALLLTNVSSRKGPKGVITTKFFDYLGAERPVLCVRSDESILENIINQTNIGVSARTVNDAYNFIIEKWNQWKEMGYTTTNVNLELKQQFSRRVQARSFVDILENASKNVQLNCRSDTKIIAEM